MNKLLKIQENPVNKIGEGHDRQKNRKKVHIYWESLKTISGINNSFFTKHLQMALKIW